MKRQFDILKEDAYRGLKQIKDKAKPV